MWEVFDVNKMRSFIEPWVRILDVFLRPSSGWSRLGIPNGWYFYRCYIPLVSLLAVVPLFFDPLFEMSANTTSFVGSLLLFLYFWACCYFYIYVGVIAMERTLKNFKSEAPPERIVALAAFAATPLMVKPLAPLWGLLSELVLQSRYILIPIVICFIVYNPFTLVWFGTKSILDLPKERLYFTLSFSAFFVAYFREHRG